nr:hypothetical protein [Bartonella massiliensis]
MNIIQLDELTRKFLITARILCYYKEGEFLIPFWRGTTWFYTKTDRHKRARAFVVAYKSAFNLNATACLKQSLRRIRALRTVPTFVCQMGASVLRIFGLFNL